MNHPEAFAGVLSLRGPSGHQPPCLVSVRGVSAFLAIGRDSPTYGRKKPAMISAASHGRHLGHAGNIPVAAIEQMLRDVDRRS